MGAIVELASYRHCIERIREQWPAFAQKRTARLVQQERYGAATEKVAENVLEDLFTEVLDWAVSDLSNQVRYADLLLTSNTIKYLLVEVKRPGSLAWSRRSVERALEQARGYADEQKVKCIAVSDGLMLYGADIVHGGMRDRLYVSLDSATPPEALWWLSVHGIYRDVEPLPGAPVELPEETEREPTSPGTPSDATGVLHHKYHIPARCFAYVGDASNPATWKLPFRLADDSIDLKRLPKAIGSLLSNYRGAKVGGIPQAAIPDVLVRLAKAAAEAGKLPHQAGHTAPIYEQLVEVLAQLGRENEVT